jgi:acetoacetate decarboxylase
MVPGKELAMERPGRLARQNFGYSMPVDAPLYPKPPIYYRDAEAISVLYETDAEAAAAMVPEGLVVPSLRRPWPSPGS